MPTRYRGKGPNETDSGGSADDDSGDDEQSASMDGDPDQYEARTDGRRVGRNQGHEPTWHDSGNIDDVEDVMLEAFPNWDDEFGAAIEVITRNIGEIPEPPPMESIQYNLHEYLGDGCESTVRATHGHCPAEGSFGLTVLAQATYARYECRLPYRKIADRFQDLLDLEFSGASAWHCVERVASAGRGKYVAIRDQIRECDVVHVDETGLSLNGKQGGSEHSKPMRRPSKKLPPVAGARYAKMCSARTSTNTW